MSTIDEFDPYNEAGGNQNNNRNVVNGGNTAMCIIALLAAVVAATVAIDTRLFQQGKLDAVERRMNDKVNATETRAMDYAYLAKQEARIALEKGQQVELQLKEKRR